MKFYNETKLLYVETDVSGVGLGAALLQTRSNNSCHKNEYPDNNTVRPITFDNKSLTGAVERYNNIKREDLCILYRLEKFHHYCFVREVSIITDHKLLFLQYSKKKTWQHYHKDYDEFY